MAWMRRDRLPGQPKAQGRAEVLCYWPEAGGCRQALRRDGAVHPNREFAVDAVETASAGSATCGRCAGLDGTVDDEAD